MEGTLTYNLNSDIISNESFTYDIDNNITTVVSEISKVNNKYSLRKSEERNKKLKTPREIDQALNSNLSKKKMNI